MPRINSKEQDLSYEGPEPQIYRRYTEKTIRKLEQLVLGRGMKTSSVAKVLKMNNSSAKMVIRKLRNEKAKKQQMASQNCQELQIKIENSDDQKAGITQGLEQCQERLNFYWVYYPVYYYETVVLNKSTE